MNSPPSTLGQYQIIREIARSNDIVYEAYDPLMNRRVAIKELAMPQGASGPQQEERINRFKREAQAAGTLNHPNIMTVFSFAEDSGRTFMAMEYLDGGTLRNEIDTKGFVPVERAISIATDVLEGLGHAHSKGVIHRDIKPDNIQILSNGTIKITDFGIARLTFQPNLTMDGQVFGTPSYMSPEQVVGKEIDQRSDLFSVGVVLYEMIGGQKPFAGDSVVAITYAIMNTDPVQPAQADYALWQVIAKALDKSPQMRFANAEEMIKALKDAQAATQSGIAGAINGPTPVNYGANPYLSPPPIPQQQQPIYTYNPYQPQPQMAPPPSPYQTTPYQTTPYQGNPYQPVQYPYQAGPSMAPPGTFPVYYPPPPRVPLMKPETAAFLKKMCISVLLLGALAGLILAGMSAITDSFKNANNDAKDNNMLPESLLNLPANMPVSEKIERATSKLNENQSDGRKAEIKRYISKLYDTKGRVSFAQSNLAEAEMQFISGTQIDKDNAQVWSDLAMVRQQLAEHTQDAERIGMLRDAGDDWNNAYRLETNQQQRAEDAKGAATSYLAFAQASLDIADRNQMAVARLKLYDVRGLVNQLPDMDTQIKDMLSKLSY